MGFFVEHIYYTLTIIVFYFRTHEDQNKRKRKKIENGKPLEELYENNVSKMMEEKDGKIVRMLLPIKTKNGVLEKRIIEEDVEVTNEDNESTNNNQEENEKSDEEENSDMEIDVDTDVRLKSI